MDREEEKEVLRRYVTSSNKRVFELFFAAGDGNLEEVRTLVEEGVDPNQWTDAPLFSYPLIEAARWERPDVVRYLLDKGANPNKVCLFLVSALIYASEAGNLEIAKCLVEKGADVNHITGQRGGQSQSALFAAVNYGRLQVVKYLLESGADTEVNDERGACPLIYVAGAGDDTAMEIVRLLIERGAKVEHATKRQMDDLSKGSTAIMAAALFGRVETVAYLISAGAQIGARSKDDMTALHYAAKNGHLEVVRLLVGKGADVKAKGGSAWSCFGTPLKFARRNGHRSVAEFLSSSGG